MKLASVSESALQEVLLNLELFVRRENSYSVQKQVTTVLSHMPRRKFNCHAESPPKAEAEIIDLYTRRRV